MRDLTPVWVQARRAIAQQHQLRRAARPAAVEAAVRPSAAAAVGATRVRLGLEQAQRCRSKSSRRSSCKRNKPWQLMGAAPMRGASRGRLGGWAAHHSRAGQLLPPPGSLTKQARAAGKVQPHRGEGPDCCGLRGRSQGPAPTLLLSASTPVKSSSSRSPPPRPPPRRQGRRGWWSHRLLQQRRQQQGQRARRSCMS